MIPRLLIKSTLTLGGLVMTYAGFKTPRKARVSMKRKQRSKERSSSGILQSHRETVQGDAQQLIAGLMEELQEVFSFTLRTVDAFTSSLKKYPPPILKKYSLGKDKSIKIRLTLI
jgi:hypothetical protein